jgi:RHS repeat-associated protein
VVAENCESTAYYRARYYNSLTGRFLSRDPEAGKPADPKTLHKYLYAGGDPVNRIDPSGRAQGRQSRPRQAPGALPQLRGLSQRELAQRVNVVQAVISDYEVGKLRLTAEAALRFAAALDVPIQELLQTAKPPEVVQERRPSRKVLQRLEQIENLPRRKQEALLTTIDAFLSSATG